MVLRKSLVIADIPHCNKMREAIMSGWQRSFTELKSELAVSLSPFVLSLYYLHQSIALSWEN